MWDSKWCFVYSGKMQQNKTFQSLLLSICLLVSIFMPSTCIHIHPHASTYIHMHPIASTCTHIHPHAEMETSVILRERVSHYIPVSCRTLSLEFLYWFLASNHLAITEFFLGCNTWPYFYNCNLMKYLHCIGSLKS